jgi:hypothetical protein
MSVLPRIQPAPHGTARGSRAITRRAEAAWLSRARSLEAAEHEVREVGGYFGRG